MSAAYRAQEERREVRLVHELVHDDAQDLRAEDVGHRETYADGYRSTLVHCPYAIYRAHTLLTIDRSLQPYFLFGLMQKHHKLGRGEKFALPHARQVGRHFTERFWRRGDDRTEH